MKGKIILYSLLRRSASEQGGSVGLEGSLSTDKQPKCTVQILVPYALRWSK